MCWGRWESVFIVWFAMVHVWTLFEKLCAVWGFFNSPSMDFGEQPATGCCSDCSKPVRGGSCPSLSQSSPAAVSSGLVWVGKLGLQGWDSALLGFSVGSARVSMAGDCELPPTGLPCPASQQGCGDKNHFRRVRGFISTLLRNPKNISHKKLSLFLPIIDTDKLIKSNFSLFSVFKLVKIQ